MSKTEIGYACIGIGKKKKTLQILMIDIYIAIAAVVLQHHHFKSACNVNVADDKAFCILLTTFLAHPPSNLSTVIIIIIIISIIIFLFSI